MRQLITTATLALIILLLPLPALAQNITIQVDGQTIQTDIPPYIGGPYNSTTYVPLRFVSEALGAHVEWIEAYKEVNMYHPGHDLYLSAQVGEYVLKANGNHIMQFYGPCELRDGRAFVPLRVVAKMFGCNVTWDNGLITITSPQAYTGPPIKYKADARYMLGTPRSRIYSLQGAPSNMTDNSFYYFPFVQGNEYPIEYIFDAAGNVDSLKVPLSVILPDLPPNTLIDDTIKAAVLGDDMPKLIGDFVYRRAPGGEAYEAMLDLSDRQIGLMSFCPVQSIDNTTLHLRIK